MKKPNTKKDQRTLEMGNGASSPFKNKARLKTPRLLAEYAGVLMVCLMASPAFAQLERATTQLTNIETWLISIGVIIFTIAMAIVGYRMAFKNATWGDVINVFFGGVLAGGAAGFAAFIFGGA